MKLPPLPAMDYHSKINASYGYSTAQVRAIQIAAALAALEEAAKVCDQTDMRAKPKLGVDCADAIRALRIEGETP